ncbi:transglycosylase domain-containing protein [Leucobacter sp. CSA1]|uniref:Transglycosylase domain-containing protein n=1 Tax=Leucobacter chromiisoli TaxID=2796471 RepID=A0A934Q996_9MICO|nr:transglycosylase domain-containing protein [Leucobacter chromiisoli]MBK0420236.1 transglycosylase domain-containing protein [Leucobacter chromiisoli]
MTPTSPKPSRPKSGAARTVKPRSAGGALSGVLGAIAMSAVAGVLLTAAVTPVVAFSGLAANSAIDIFENLPENLDPGQLAQPSTIWAKDSAGTDVKLAEFYAQDREPLEWNEIPQTVKDAVVSEEDPRFYTHGGVDVLATSRAVLQNATGRNLSGASTVTMQYVRNVLVQEAEAIPDPDESEAAYEDAMRQDMDRKLQEMRYAISIEKQYSKDEILLGYLNIALFGRQIYGIESAAHYYYSKSAKDLSLAEAASLVAIVNNPSKLQIDLPDNIPANQDRRDKILGSMLREGKITQAQYDEAIATPVTPKITPRVQGCGVAEQNYGAGHFCNYVQLYIRNDPSFGNTPAERMFNFERGGYDIHTTLDLDMQAAANSSIQGTVPATMDGIDVGAAAVSTQVGTGRVLAMAQNRAFSNDPKVLETNPALTSINYNTDNEYGGSNGFQVGSTFKAITLAEWIRAGHSVRETVNANGRTEQFQNFRAHCLPDGVAGYGTWTFQNDQGRQQGNRTVQYVVEQSVNGGIVSMQKQLDLCDTFETAKNLGIQRASDQIFNEDMPNYGTRDLFITPSTVYAGTDEISPITMASAFAAFAGEGTVCTPVPIDSITGSDGAEVSFTKSSCKSGISPEVAAGVAYTLESTVNRGLAGHARSNIGVPHLAKTGTTDNVEDNWTVGASTSAATAVWVGNVTGNVSTMNYGGFGGLMAADQTIWPTIMNVADAKYGGNAFPPPPATATRQIMQEVPDVTGKSFEEASQMLTGAGFTVTDGGETDSAQPEGQVARTDPAAGSSVAAGSAITVYRSNGEMSTLPDVVGEEGSDAERALAEAGFDTVTMPSSCRNKEITSMSPSAGSEAKRSSQITLGCS